MKVRLAITAAVLALGVTAFTPTPTVAAGPSGILICQPLSGDPIPIRFAPVKFPLQEAVAGCREFFLGHPVLIVIDR